jgi:hypothetical protein
MQLKTMSKRIMKIQKPFILYHHRKLIHLLMKLISCSHGDSEVSYHVVAIERKRQFQISCYIVAFLYCLST